MECQCHFNHVFLAAQRLSAGHLPQQPRPRTVHLLFGAQHQDLPWILLLPLQFLLTPRLLLVHHQSHLDLGHPSMPLTATRIPSVHLHRSPPGQLVSHLVCRGMLLSSCIFTLLWLICCYTFLASIIYSFSVDTGVISHSLSASCFRLFFSLICL